MTDHQADAGALVDVLVLELEEVLALCSRVDHVISWFVSAENTSKDEEADSWTFPAPIAAGGLDQAYDRLFSALAQQLDLELLSGQVERRARPRVLGADGRYEHAPLRLVRVARADVAMLAEAVTVITAAIASLRQAGPYPHGHPDLVELLDQVVDDGNFDERYWAQQPTRVSDLVAPFATLVDLLDLPADADTALLADALRSRPDQDVVLTIGQEMAYGRFARRFNHVLTGGDPLVAYVC